MHGERDKGREGVRVMMDIVREEGERERETKKEKKKKEKTKQTKRIEDVGMYLRGMKRNEQKVAFPFHFIAAFNVTIQEIHYSLFVCSLLPV